MRVLGSPKQGVKPIVPEADDENDYKSVGTDYHTLVSEFIDAESYCEMRFERIAAGDYNYRASNCLIRDVHPSAATSCCRTTGSRSSRDIF